MVGFGIVDQPVAFFADMRTVWPSIVTIIVWNTVPLIALSLLSSLQTVPEDYYEAAELDGATRWQQFSHITLPFLMPAILVLGLISVFWSFNNFVYVWLATGAGPGTLTNVLATEVYIKAFVDFRVGYSSAIGMVMAVVMAIFGIVYLRLVAHARELEEKPVIAHGILLRQSCARSRSAGDSCCRRCWPSSRCSFWSIPAVYILDRLVQTRRRPAVAGWQPSLSKTTSKSSAPDSGGSYSTASSSASPRPLVSTRALDHGSVCLLTLQFPLKRTAIHREFCSDRYFPGSF